MLASMMAASTCALADLVGGQLLTGSASITQSSSGVTTITQTSQSLGLAWKRFDINTNQTVQFIQPNSSSLAVNYINDTNGTRILGNLNANGQIWLINPNGVFFGKGAQINVGSILASALNPLSDEKDKTQIFGNGGTGSIINQGVIHAADNGYVALLGNKVSNQGIITAKLGTVALGAGSQVRLTFDNNQLYGLIIDQSTLNSLAENKQLIQADGGMVLMSAGAKDSLLASMVNNTGIIEAKTINNKNGKIILTGGMLAGTTNVAGTLDASAPTSGDGGFIETSAAHVRVADTAKVTTTANVGRTGTWLIDPLNFTVAASGGDMTGAAVSSALANNNFQIQSNSGASGSTGDININDVISWSTNNTLTLTAQNNININSSIISSGAGGKLALEYGQAHVASGNASTYNVKAPINLHAGNNFSTKLGSDGSVNQFQVITSLGSEGSTTGIDLQGVNGNLSGNYALGANIDASNAASWNGGAGFDPIGTIGNPYGGIFDGLGHTISNLQINRPNNGYIGLFGSAINATIQNIGVSSGTVIGYFHVAGLLGFAQNTVVKKSFSNANVFANGTDVGGLVGKSVSITIADSYSTGNVTAQGEVGGLVGDSTANSSITGSYATGNVTGTGGTVVSVGGLVGTNQGNSSISNSFATGAVNGVNQAGGLVGENNSSSIINSYSTGSVSGVNASVGGLVGENSGTVTGSFWNQQSSGNNNAVGTGSTGGIVGVNNAQMKMLATYSLAQWDISNSASSNSVWFINEGVTGPLLRSLTTIAPSNNTIDVPSLISIVFGNPIYQSATDSQQSSESGTLPSHFFNMQSCDCDASNAYIAILAEYGQDHQSGYPFLEDEGGGLKLPVNIISTAHEMSDAE